jgi:hypothetical protein
MNMKLISTFPGRTTFKNATSTFKHLIQVGDTFYVVEVSCEKDILKENIDLTAENVVRCEPKEVVFPTSLLMQIEAFGGKSQ